LFTVLLFLLRRGKALGQGGLLRFGWGKGVWKRQRYQADKTILMIFNKVQLSIIVKKAWFLF
jgi:hypothetical protein